MLRLGQITYKQFIEGHPEDEEMSGPPSLTTSGFTLASNAGSSLVIVIEESSVEMTPVKGKVKVKVKEEPKDKGKGRATETVKGQGKGSVKETAKGKGSTNCS